MPSCLVNQCVSKTGRKGQSEQIILHPFPKDLTRIKIWLLQTGQIFKDLNALAQKILDENKQNKYRLCSCHFALDAYIFHKHSRSLKVNAIPSIFPIVKEGECIIAENLKKNRVKRVKKSLDGATAATTVPTNGGMTGEEEPIWDENQQNQYRLCSCHFTPEPYLLNSQGRYVEVDAIPSIFPIVNEKECIVEDGTKRPALTASINERITAEEETFQDIQLTKIGFYSIGTQTDYTLSNSVVVSNKKPGMGSDDQDGPPMPDAAVTASLGLVSKLKRQTESLLQEVPIRFDDVAVYFSPEEWESLGMMEKLLYMDVMVENYYNLFSLGFVYEKPEIISRIEKGLDFCPTAGFVYEKPEIVSRVQKSPDPCPTADLPPIKVKEEHEHFSETDVSTRYWKVESSVGGQQELMLQVETCNGMEHPVYPSEDFTRKDLVQQTFYNGNKCVVQTHGGQSQGRTWTGSDASRCELEGKSHLSGRYYPCTDCGKCFNRSSNLLRHKRIHVGERPYFCGNCGKSFIDSSKLVVHRRTHTGESTYACGDCASYVGCTL